MRVNPSPESCRPKMLEDRLFCRRNPRSRINTESRGRDAIDEGFLDDGDQRLLGSPSFRYDIRPCQFLRKSRNLKDEMRMGAERRPCPAPAVSFRRAWRRRWMPFRSRSAAGLSLGSRRSSPESRLDAPLARFLRLISLFGGSLSPSTSGADRSLPGVVPSFRQVPDGV